MRGRGAKIARVRGIGRLAAGAAMVLIACGQGDRARPGAAATPSAPGAISAAARPTPPPAGYVPGLGELMTLQQMRHAKLWWAGDAGNWRLTSYELDELAEGFDDIVLYHPTHKDAPLPIRDAVPKIMGYPLKQAREAIANKDRRAFAAAYDALTAGCNACHQATNFGFNVVQRPTVNTFSNQSFAPADARDR